MKKENMKKLKHLKYKNTGLIFELLSRQVTNELLSGNNSDSINLIKEFFKKNTNLHKELLCYQALSDSKTKSEAAASKLIDVILEYRKKINDNALLKEKYRLIGELKNKYDLASFFSSKVPEYKLYASIYKLFEGNKDIDFDNYLEQYDVLVEHISNEKLLVEETSDSQLWKNQPDDIKPLALKMIIKRFNDKYKNLSERQKKLINKYVVENTELDPFKDFIYKEAVDIKNTLLNKRSKITDKSLLIKLNEVIKLADNILMAKRITEEHISSMVKYYELVDYLNTNAK